MKKYEVKQIDNLLNLDLNIIIKQSKEEGFLIGERLVFDYKNGTNTFNNLGEALYGVFNINGEIVAIGGLNKDPFSTKPYIGRVRRFYVINEYRRNGIGSLLLKNIINEAKKYYKILVLRTNTSEGDNFYTSNGFLKVNIYPSSTHYMDLGN
ncbi:GNAT family N-acetyltransferase [Rossellomorea aquimaris]|jgi:predicted acetyltransferase|uniref:GNAT family N-acetyltransferase n=1 Tax=Rossellomorea aquimaris TaxID=189382 RepID=A0A1J6WUV4_9BACI|nr:GNAT family N-acetyltransferase [Rossellomorea aquimaris]OIU71655.1 GNAT family N-acetyltransferase [Rossellomorea aquimaris]